jgi:hypothetical protein
MARIGGKMKLLIKYIWLFFIFTIFTASIAGSTDREIGQCMAWIKQAEVKFGKSPEIKEDLFRGLLGWVAMKHTTPLSIKQIDDLASSSNPDINSCDAAGLKVSHLTVLEYILFHEETDWIDSKLKNCSGALFALDTLAAQTNNNILSNYLYFMGGRVGGVSTYLGRDFQKDIMVSGERLSKKMLLKGSDHLKDNDSFKKALSDCTTFGIDTDYMKHIAGFPNK